jgi:small subunit ribosomal protein S19e
VIKEENDLTYKHSLKPVLKAQELIQKVLANEEKTKMIYTVNQHELVLALAQELKNHIEMPEWAKFVKTGVHRETIPRNPDWWYLRAASILRFSYKQGPIGVNKLKTKYGGKQNRGVRPDKFALASGKIIRVILQQLESAKLVEQVTVKTFKGRKATPTGASLIAKAAKEVVKHQTAKTTPGKEAKKSSVKVEQEEIENEKSSKEATKKEEKVVEEK